MKARIALLPGDGIGPEVTGEAERVLRRVAERYGHQFEMESYPIGGNAIDAFGDPLPEQTLKGCQSANAVLLGAVGGPKWDNPSAKTRPEAGLLRIRKELGLFANLRPVKPFVELMEASPLKADRIAGVDILFVRELTGGLYFGDSGRKPAPDGEVAWNTMIYSTGEIERVVRLAAELARKRRKKLTMVDKANVLEVSRLWRSVSERVIKTEFPDLQYNVVLVDAMAMYLVSRPADFDVVVTENMFGDILTDEAAMLPGSLGMLPSASLGTPGPGLYEPIHGSAPDIAGKGIANPLGTILAAAMLLRHSLNLETEARCVEAAVEKVLAAGLRTKDLAGSGQAPITTTQMGKAVLERV